MAQFKDFLTNPAYIGGYNAIFSGNTADREKGMVFVEDNADVWFWQCLFDDHLPNQYDFRPATQEDGTIQQGKTALRKLYHGLNRKVLVARDADYDWLFPTPQDDLENPFILHTFAYSKESVLIEKQNLSIFFSRIQHTVKHHVNINQVVEKFSQLIFMGLCGLTCQYLASQDRFLTTNFKAFNDIFNTLEKPLVLDNLAFDFGVFDGIQQKIEDFFNTKFDFSEEQMREAETYLYQHGITQENAYRFISGHLLDEFIQKIRDDLCRQLKTKELEKVKKEIKGEMITDRKNQLNAVFKTNFVLPTYYRQYLINMNDEIHVRILDKIKKIEA